MALRGGVAPLPLVSHGTHDLMLHPDGGTIRQTHRMAIRKDDDRDLALFCPGTLELGDDFGRMEHDETF